MNIKYTRHMNLLRRAIGIGTLCLVASVGFVHAESIAIPSARPMVDGVSADVETVRSSSKAEPHASAGVILSLIHISEPTRLHKVSRMPSSA